MNIKTLMRVSTTILRNCILKIYYGPRYKCTFLNSCSISTHISIQKKSKLIIGKHLSSLARLEIGVRNGGKCVIGDYVNFNKDCTIVCHEHITIGDNCLFGPGCQVFDHDHDYTQTDIARKTHFLTGSIEIGNGVWFGANCVILRNTKIGDNCVFGAGTIIKGTYPPNTLVVQKREEVCKSILCTKSRHFELKYGK